MMSVGNVVPIPLETIPDSACVERAARGDERAFESLIRGHERILYRTAWAILANNADAADAVQEAIFSAWRALPSLRNPDWFRTWLVRITINECKQLLRRRSRTVSMDNMEFGTEEIPLDEGIDVLRALHALPEKYRIPVVLYYYEDFSVEMIAGALRLPQGTVKSRLYLARKELKARLEVD